MVLSMDFIGLIVFLVSFGWIPILIMVGLVMRIGGRWSDKR